MHLRSIVHAARGATLVVRRAVAVIAAAAIAAGTAPVAQAQTPGPLVAEDRAVVAATAAPDSNADQPVAVWATASAGVGRGTRSRNAVIAGQLALWGAAGQIAFGARVAGVSSLEDDSFSDAAVLAGLRFSAPGVVGGTALFAVGLGEVSYYPTNGGATRMLGLAVATEFGVNLRVIGVGISGFAAAGTKTAFAGVGLSFQLGKIQ